MTDSALITEADVIKNEVTLGANTASRVGIMLEDIINNKINNDKISTNVSLGTDDTLVPSQKAVKSYVDGKISAIVTVKVLLTSAEILSLHTSPKILVAAKGPSTLIVPIGTVVFYGVYATTPYDTNINLSLATGTIFERQYTGTLGFTGTTLESLSTSVSLSSSVPADSLNVDLVLSAVVGNPMNGDSTIAIYLSYQVISF